MEKYCARVITMLLLAACLLAACATQPTSTAASPASPSASPPADTSAPPAASLEPAEPAAESPGEPSADLLPGLDAAALKAAMPEEDGAAFETFLPILRGEQTFRWVEADQSYEDYYPGFEPFDADMTVLRDRLWDGFGGGTPETLTLDRLTVQDIDGDGTAELVLLFQDGAYNYLILHREEDAVYGTVLYVRWFEGLQKNGVYWGSGGAGDSIYYRMAFRNGRFEEQELAHRLEWATGADYTLGGQQVTKEAFDAWYAENLVGDVTWYAPDGSAIPEGQ